MILGHDGTPANRLWSPDFLRFFVARTMSMAGDTMLPVALTAAMVQAGYGASGVGYALAAHIAPLAVCVVFGGVLSDRFGARRMMVGADAGRLLVEGVLAAFFLVTTPPLWLVLALLVPIGLGTALFQPGVATMIPRIAAMVVVVCVLLLSVPTIRDLRQVDAPADES